MTTKKRLDSIISTKPIKSVRSNLQTRQLNRLVNSVRKEWGEAESLIRESELITASIAVSAVNELRYAGTHVVLSLDDIAAGQDNTKATKDLERALRHIRRSKADSRDQLICYINRDIKRMMARYGGPSITEKFSSFQILISKLDEVLESRQSTMNEHQIHSKSNMVSEKFAELRSLHKQLLVAESVLRPRPKATEKWVYLFYIFYVLVALTGTILAILAGL